jgi:hypothetical protein
MITNLVANAVRTAIGAAKRAVAVDVTIQRGDDSVTTTAGLGQSRFELVQGDVIKDVRSLDLLIAIDDYDLGDGAVTPAEGDRYEVDDGVTVITLEACPYPPEPAWRYTDRFRTAYRIHTKQVKEADAE